MCVIVRIVAIFFCAAAASAGHVGDEISLVGTALIAGDASDLSGVSGVLADGTPKNRLGGFGSAIAYTGENGRYLAVVDRGPKDGATAFACRFHEFELAVDAAKSPAVRVTLKRTVRLTNSAGASLVGASSAFDVGDAGKTVRFDPEGIAVGGKHTVFISDEYGPAIDEFTLDGKRVRSLNVPKVFAIAHPKAEKKDEIAANTSGRRTNKGFEGLTISPDGGKIYALLQGPLLQDAPTACRLLEIDLKTGADRQFVVALTHRKLGFCELLAISDHEFLVIERDDESGKSAKFKKIMRIDIAGATDVRTMAAIDEKALAKIVAVKKTAWLDLLDPRFGLAGKAFPEKVEGLTFGPTLADGRRVLVVTTDNDCDAREASAFWVFAVRMEQSSATE